MKIPRRQHICHRRVDLTRGRPETRPFLTVIRLVRIRLERPHALLERIGPAKVRAAKAPVAMAAVGGEAVVAAARSGGQLLARKGLKRLRVAMQ